MLKLIVNADDLGAGHETDRGIFQAFTAGLVTSASLLATGPSARQAAERARELELPLGVHLNLSEGFALTGELPGLTDPTGRFPGKQPLRQILTTGDFEPAALATELRAQIEQVRSFGVTPDHLDSHQHFFLWPPLTRLVIELAHDCGISALRCPVSLAGPNADSTTDLQRDLDRYRALAGPARAALLASGLRYPQGLVGMELLDRLDGHKLRELIARLPSTGCLELMVHPGYLDPENPFGGRQREEELEALTNIACREQLQQAGVKLICFGDLPCGC